MLIVLKCYQSVTNTTEITYNIAPSPRSDQYEINYRQFTLSQHSCKTQIYKLANAAEKAFADWAILLDENLLLFEQNNKRNTRQPIKATAVSKAKVISYKDIIKAQTQRDIKEASGDKLPRQGQDSQGVKQQHRFLGKDHKVKN